MCCGVNEDVSEVDGGKVDMAEFGLKLTEKSDLCTLIDNKIFENNELEYKNYTFSDGKFSIPDKSRDKFMQEIAAFANTNGGTIVIGMQEDNNGLPIKLSGTGMALGNFDNWLSSFRQIVLSRIRPHLHGIKCVPIPVDGEQNIAIVISIPKSVARPHSFWDGNKDEFFMRYANGIMYMDIGDLRKAFVYSSGLQDKIRQFRRDRIALILANECVGDFGNVPKLVLHIIPEWSFELGNTIALKQFEKDGSFQPIYGSRWRGYYNADGYYIAVTEDSTGKIQTYTQIFHSGIIEMTDIQLLSRGKENIHYNWTVIDGTCRDKIKDYCEILDEMHIPKPWHISISILNGKGAFTDIASNIPSLLDRDIVNSLDGIYADDSLIQDALRPVFDSLANAFGSSRSAWDK